MTDPFDIDETRWEHASKRMSSLPWYFGPAWAVVGAVLGGFLASISTSLARWSWWFVALSAFGMRLVAYGVWRLAYKLQAARRQRDVARARLVEIKKAANEYSIVPTNARSTPDGPDSIVQVTVKNEGRGALFAVVIESIEGTEEGLIDPYAPLYWMGRPNVLNEEIPPMESRVVGLGWLSGGVSGDLKFTPMSPDGTSHRRSYYLLSGRTTIHFLVSARGNPELSYTRPISVSILWPGLSSEPQIEEPKSDDERVHRFSPPVTKLADFRASDGEMLAEGTRHDPEGSK